ncbi:flagellum-specific ATP synthase [uncultured Desulfatiglans sp.]|nr:flagellum-specific ATP synthase [uncultured Desulfatiglans sp.]
MVPIIDFSKYHRTLQHHSPIRAIGRVTKVVGFLTEANGPVSSVGSICEIYSRECACRITAEVLGFRDDKVLLMPLGDLHSISPGSRVVSRQGRATVPVGERLLGRVVDGMGSPIDGKGPIGADAKYPIYAEPLNPLLRKRIERPLDVGVRAVNGLLTIGRGQRMGIFAGSGVGKSVLLGMMARNTTADVNVIALIGERGREVKDFIEKHLGEEGLRRSVVVVATSDCMPVIRMRGAFIAMAIAEYFRDRGQQVLLLMDSITRFAMAQREVTLAAGEPPTTKGYTPSVFAQLPRLLERAGTSAGAGSITGLYTVLVEGDDMNDPIADSVRSILDGHIVLSRDLAHQRHYPAIDILGSISRIMDDIVNAGVQKNADEIKRILAAYRKAEDIINIGAYARGSNKDIDYAIKMIDKIKFFLQQDKNERVSYEQSIEEMDRILKYD